MNRNNPDTTKKLCIVLMTVVCICLILIIISVANGGGIDKILNGGKSTAAPAEKPADDNTPVPGSEGTPVPSGEGTPNPSNEPTNAPTNSPTPEPTHDPNRTLVSEASVVALGDNLYHNGMLIDAQERAKAEGNGKDFSFNKVYEDIRDKVYNADISIINQESLILPKHYFNNKLSYYVRSDGSFVSPQELMETLQWMGIDIVDMANNHMLDMSSAGEKWGVDYYKTLTGIMGVGAYYTEEDSENIRVYEKNGIKIAVLAYTYGTNVPQSIATRDDPTMPYYVPVIEDGKMLSDLARAKEKADFTMVLIHWGTEQEEVPNNEQKRVAKLLAENGAGIIIGHHSHCLQPIEYIDDGKGGKVLCTYSLGTLASNMSAEKNMLAGIFEFNLKKWSDGSVTVENPKFEPTVFYYDMEYRNSKIYYLRDMTDSLCASHGIGNYPKNSSTKNKMTGETLRAYLKKTIDSEFLPEEYK